MFFFSTPSLSSFLNSKTKKEKKFTYKNKSAVLIVLGSIGMSMYVAVFYFVFIKKSTDF